MYYTIFSGEMYEKNNNYNFNDFYLNRNTSYYQNE